MPKPPIPNDPQPARTGTLVETDEDIRRAEFAENRIRPPNTPCRGW